MTQDIDQALNAAIDECIETGILSDDLGRKQEDVIEMLKLPFIYEEDVRIQREEAEKIGFDKGFEDGIKEIKLKAVKHWLALGFAAEVISKATELSVQKIEAL